MSRTDKDRPIRIRRDDDRDPCFGYVAKPPPRWYINHRWSAPDRLAVRLNASEAIAEHRAGHEPEAEPPTDQHRHGALWEWN